MKVRKPVFDRGIVALVLILTACAGARVMMPTPNVHLDPKHDFYGELDREQTVTWLTNYALNSRERADQRIKFFDAYRSYVINYNLGKDMVREYVERGAPDQSARWRKFEYLLSSPMLPGDLE